VTIRPWLVAVGLVAVVVAAHGGAIRGEFHYDDKVSVTENLAIRIWQPWFYLTSPLAATSEPGAAGYRPLTVATFAMNYAIGGLDPSGYLVGNLLLHLAASWLVFVVGRVLLRDDRWAALAALLYAVHPVNSEAVNYVVARSSLLAVCGALVACWAYLRREAGGGWGWTVCGGTAFLAALLSKESAVAVLVPLGTYHLLAQPGGSARSPSGSTIPWRRAGAALLPYVVVFGVYLVVWWTVAGSQVEQHGRVALYPAWTVLEVVGRSLLLWMWPYPLSLDHPLVFPTRFDAMTAGWLAAEFMVFLGVAIGSWRRRPLVSWCLIWALAGLAPLAPLPWMTINGLMQESRLAFSAVGLAWLTAIAAGEAWAAWRRVAPRLGAARARPIVEGIAIVGGMVLLVLAVVVDRARSAVWSDNVRLWQEVVTRSPESRSAYVNLGSAYMAREDYDRAENAFRRAVAITPNEALPYYALGALAYRRGQYDQARQLFLKTASMAPDYANTYRMLGLIAIRENRNEDATVLLRRALMLDPRDALALANLGLVAQRAGDDAAAAQWYRDTLAVDPAQSLARNNLGTLYLKQRRWADALEQFSELLDREPDDYDAALNRAVALNALGRREEAKASLDALLARLPPDPRFDPHRRGAALILSRVAP
jgi:tetratricopeptide (TPR) repeat protein